MITLHGLICLDDLLLWYTIGYPLKCKTDLTMTLTGGRYAQIWVQFLSGLRLIASVQGIFGWFVCPHTVKLKQKCSMKFPTK